MNENPMGVAPEDLPEDVQEVLDEASLVASQSTELSITTPEQAVAVNDTVRSIKRQMKALDEAEKKMKRPANDTLKAIAEFFAPFRERLKAAEDKGKRAIIAWEQLRLDEERKERMRLEEQRLLEAKEREDRIRADAAAAAEAGRPDIAQQLEARADTVAPAPVTREEYKLEGTALKGAALRQIPKFEVVDASLVPAEYKTVDEVKLGKVIRAASGAITIPGVRIWMETTMASRA